ncbi:MAG: N-acetylneuraminate synthase, partial [Alphaproteobacteria bacterium]|nr:N-acetylneuraminate synthase [Alphaproteobacteria bacterium]
ADVARKSLVAARRVAAGQLLTAADLRARRPGTGLSPALQKMLVGRRATRDIAAGAMIGWGDLA